MGTSSPCYHMHGPDLGPVRRLGDALGRSWRQRFRKEGKGREEKVMGKGKADHKEAEYRAATNSGKGRQGGQPGGCKACGQRRGGAGRGVCGGRGKDEGPPYHHAAELPLLTRSPSLPGGTLGTAANINQSHSDYGPPGPTWGAAMTPKRPPRGSDQVSQTLLSPQSLHPRFYLIDSESKNTRHWPYILPDPDSMESCHSAFFILTST